MNQPPRDELAAYTALARSVIATATKDATQDRSFKERQIARQFLKGASEEDRAVLGFWCRVAGIAPDLVQRIAMEKWGES